MLACILITRKAGSASRRRAGFIDQYSKFYTREEAMILVKANGQPFNKERNGKPVNELFSEGVW